MNGAGPLQIVFGVLALWTTTILVMVIDKKIRASQSDFAPSMTEPEWGGLIALTIRCNVAALPYYFWRSRNSVGWGAPRLPPLRCLPRVLAHRQRPRRDLRLAAPSPLRARRRARTGNRLLRDPSPFGYSSSPPRPRAWIARTVSIVSASVALLSSR